METTFPSKVVLKSKLAICTVDICWWGWECWVSLRKKFKQLQQLNWPSRLGGGFRIHRLQISSGGKTRPITSVLWLSRLGLQNKPTASLQKCKTPPPMSSPVSCGCRMHRLHLCGQIRPHPECPGYETKQSDGEASVILQLWGMHSTPSLLSIPALLWPEWYHRIGFYLQVK